MPPDRRAFADPNGGRWRADPGFGIRDSGFGIRDSGSGSSRFGVLDPNPSRSARLGAGHVEGRIPSPHTSPSNAIGSGATAAASLPGSTIVSPARYRTSNRAAVRVPAIATRTRNPRSAAVRRSSSAIVRASPNNRVRPLRSSTISVGLHTSMRGENSRATSASTSGGAPSIVDSAPNTDHLIAFVGRVLFLRPAGSKKQDPAYGATVRPRVRARRHRSASAATPPARGDQRPATTGCDRTHQPMSIDQPAITSVRQHCAPAAPVSAAHTPCRSPR